MNSVNEVYSHWPYQQRPELLNVSSTLGPEHLGPTGTCDFQNLSAYYNSNLVFQHNITPLHVAAKWGKSNMVSLLLEKGANIESKTRDGLTPLHCAARSGHEQVVDMMLERGAPISCKTKVNSTITANCSLEGFF